MFFLCLKYILQEHPTNHKNCQSQAIRLPKEFCFSDDEVYIRRMGNSVILLPRQRAWDTLWSSIVRGELEHAGTPIGAMDLMIAAHALSLNITLITHNLKAFQRVPGLQAESSWVK